MSSKLQELTDKLYQEGLSKGKQEGEEILAKAKAQAEEIIASARKEADSIIAKAEKDASDLKAKVSSDINMASVQTMSTIRQQIEGAVVAKAVGTPVKGAFEDPEYVKSLISSVVKAFDANNAQAVGLDLILPEASRKKLGEDFASQIAATLGKGVDVKFAKGIAGGFKIGPKDGGYLVSFTEEDFTSLFGQYLRPATRKILFGE